MSSHARPLKLQRSARPGLLNAPLYVLFDGGFLLTLSHWLTGVWDLRRERKTSSASREIRQRGRPVPAH